MKVSVMITTFNGSKYIEDQLQCIMMQTKEPDEVIIVDDNSSDGTQSIVMDFIRNNQLVGWHFYQNTKRLGWIENSFHALELTSGDIVFVADQDDIWDSKKIEIMTDLMSKRSNCMLLVCDFINFINTRECNYYTRGADFKTSIICWKKRLNQKWMYLEAPGSAFAIKRSLIDKLCFFEGKQLATDMLLWSLALVENGLYLTNYMGTYRRVHNNNVTNEKTHDYKVRHEYIVNAIWFAKNMEKYCEASFKDPLKRNLIQYMRVFQEYRARYFDNPTALSALRLLLYSSFYKKRKSVFVDWKVGRKSIHE